MARFKDGRVFAAPPSDTDLEAQVWVAIQGDSRVDPTEISVRVENGKVHLAGMVDGAAERRAAQEDAETVVARDRIANRLTLANFVQRTNEELTLAIRHAMKRALDVDADDVMFEACDGVVTVSGRAATYAQKLAVENIVWWMPGVTDVVSRVQVDGVEEPPDEPDY